MEREA
jgi:hypothetical protein